MNTKIKRPNQKSAPFLPTPRSPNKSPPFPHLSTTSDLPKSGIAIPKPIPAPLFVTYHVTFSQVLSPNTPQFQEPIPTLLPFNPL